MRSPVIPPWTAACRRRSALVAGAILLPLLAGCPSSPYPEVAVDLASSRPAPTAVQKPRTAVLRFSVAAMQSPQDTFASYSRLFERLEPKLEVRIELVQRRTYQEVNELLASGQLDAALVCTGGYVDLERHQPGAVEVIAVPVVHGRTTYQSYVIVPADSTARELSDLAGKRFAFTDDLSLSGFAYPSHLVRELHGEAATFFGSVTFTHSHDRSIEAVAKGVVDGAAVDSLVYDELARTSPHVRTMTRVIHRSPPYGVAPVVVSTRLRPEQRAALRDALLHLHDDPEARVALALVGFDRFVPPEADLYAAASALVVGRR
nr:phosphate/phosphite/phosphonate ABC transporter substrate-binding protein [Anaeromyxobacter sp. PSR-1]